MTTRKLRGAAALASLLAAGVTTGCATRGPLHVYTLTAGAARPVLDTGDGRTTESPSFLEPDERVSGFAYDPFTDHFFLRLDPGDRIRVVDRADRKIKREFEIAGAARGEGDLAVRPRDGHLFLLGARPAGIIETTRLGKLVREFTLAATAGPPSGLAFDAARNQLLALGADGRSVTVHDLQGAPVRTLQLAQPAAAALAFDSDQREFYAALRDRPGEIGVFAEDGRLVRTQPATGGTDLLDVGQRSLVRVF